MESSPFQSQLWVAASALGPLPYQAKRTGESRAPGLCESQRTTCVALGVWCDFGRCCCLAPGTAVENSRLFPTHTHRSSQVSSSHVSPLRAQNSSHPLRLWSGSGSWWGVGVGQQQGLPQGLEERVPRGMRADGARLPFYAAMLLIWRWKEEKERREGACGRL